MQARFRTSQVPHQTYLNLPCYTAAKLAGWQAGWVSKSFLCKLTIYLPVSAGISLKVEALRNAGDL